MDCKVPEIEAVGVAADPSKWLRKHSRIPSRRAGRRQENNGKRAKDLDSDACANFTGVKLDRMPASHWPSDMKFPDPENLMLPVT